MLNLTIPGNNGKCKMAIKKCLVRNTTKTIWAHKSKKPNSPSLSHVTWQNISLSLPGFLYLKVNNHSNMPLGNCQETVVIGNRFSYFQKIIYSAEAGVHELADLTEVKPDECVSGTQSTNLIRRALRWHMSLFNFYDRIYQPLIELHPELMPEESRKEWDYPIVTFIFFWWNETRLTGDE